MGAPADANISFAAPPRFYSWTKPNFIAGLDEKNETI